MMKKIHELMAWHVANEEGATAVEYGLMVALIAVVIIGAVTALGGSLSDLFQGIADSIDGAGE